jgi:signal transduction histidine kinase
MPAGVEQAVSQPKKMAAMTNRSALMHTISLRGSPVTPTVMTQSLSGLVFGAPFTRRTWCELVYAVTDPLAAAAGLACVAALCVLGPAFIAIAGGTGMAGLAGLAGIRPLAAAERRRARALLHVRLPRLTPPPVPARRRFGWVRPVVADAAGWRVVAYLILRPPYAAAVFTVAVAFWGGALACLASPVWLSYADHPTTMAGTAGFFAAGVILLFVAPWPVRGAVTLSKLLLRLTLDPAAHRQRVRYLEQARGHAIEHSAAMLRRIERDLHEGAQASLVAMTMRLSVAREQLASATGPDADATRELLDEVHRDATRAMAELRDLTRGIRPPALDAGLGAAIESLTAHSPVPVDLRVSMAERPSPGIETIAYLCAAELFANICQHSRASYACIDLAQRDQCLLIQVTDDGMGGACTEPGHGLADLADQVRSVDGTLSMHSPPGGPTLVTAMLPFRV